MFKHITEDTNINYVLTLRMSEILLGKVPESDILSECQKLSPEEILEVSEALDKEIKYASLENMILEDFLNENGPKLLIGLTDEEIAADLKKIPDSLEGVAHKHVRIDETIRRGYSQKSFDTSSQGSLASLFKKPQSIRPKRTKEQSLTYKAKQRLLMKTCISIKAKIEELTRKSFEKRKEMSILLENMKYEVQEVDDLFDVFSKNVVELGFDPNTGLISSESYLI